MVRKIKAFRPVVDVKQQVVAKYRQYYSGEEEKAPDRYCVLTVSSEKKALLLKGDEEATSEVMIAFFRSELLLIGNGLTHSIDFMELNDVQGRHEAVFLEL